LLDILRKYGFPPEYLNWIKVIYTDLRASLLINGYQSTIFNIERSVKQGDALSCALFVIAMDPLLRAIEKDTRIQPVTVIDKNNTIRNLTKTVSYADDITGICANEEGINAIIELYTKFSNTSGIKLNINKTEILVLGKLNNIQRTFIIKSGTSQYIITDQDAVKVCGITFSNNEEVAYKENVTKKIDKLEGQLNVWRQRNLTLQGKILIVKTFGISQLVYSMRATVIKNKDLKQIELIIFKFVWNIKPNSKKVSGKIKREIMKMDIASGGLSAPDIYSLDLALKYKHVMRALNNTHPISTIMTSHIGYESPDNILYKSKKDTCSSYLSKAMECNKIFINKITEDLEDLTQDQESRIHKMYFEFIHNYPLNDSYFTKVQQQSMIKRLKLKEINTYGEVIQEWRQKSKPELWFEIGQLLNTFPKVWKQYWLARNNKSIHKTDNLPISMNIWKTHANISTKQIKNRIINIKQLNENEVKNLVSLKHDFPLDENMVNPFLELRKWTKETNLRNVQYKILHNIYPTAVHLHKWCLRASPDCGHCQQVETIKHAIYDCEIARETLMNFKHIMLENIGIDISITQQEMITGTKRYPGINNIINCILLLIKRALILQRETKRILTETDLNGIIKNQLRKEHFIAQKNNEFAAFNKKWGR